MALRFEPRGDYRSWGGVVRAEHDVARLARPSLAAAALAGNAPVVVHGAGRSYGDLALNPGGRLVDCRGLDRFIAFDRQTGELTCEAGVTLADILTVVRAGELDQGGGWFLPVSPGTRYVTVGGAIANDVHGKNHHLFGTFGEHVLSLQLARADGVVHCTRTDNGELFRATIGGLGLTGIIVSATLQLRRVPGYALEAEHLRFGSLDEFFDLAAQSENEWEYTAAWIDCLAKGRALGRGIFSRARHSLGPSGPSNAQPTRGVPIEMPISMVNGLTVPVFNAMYWRKLGPGIRKKRVRIGYEAVLYPLDSIASWNRVYGPKGFYQFQSVTPLGAPDRVAALLAAIGASGQGSMLTVLKSFADRPAAGMMSFPMAGFTLAVDFPNEGDVTRSLMAKLEAIVVECGGRLYPAKDGLMSAESFRRGYPELDAFTPFLEPGLSSAFARRVGISPLSAH